ncbi:MAG: PAS domain S-box protein [Deltaproteobacteria bacterium]|nr:PAS domain S-box protein [Deltaproteobacteria bacterium]
MNVKAEEIINIGIVGGGVLARDVLEKTYADYRKKDVRAKIIALADNDLTSPGVTKARELGLKVTEDYRDFFLPEYDIHLIMVLTPENKIFDDILGSKPDHIRVLAYHVFDMFWRATNVEEKKLRNRTEEFETIFNAIQDFIVVITPEHEIVEVNEAFLKTMGYTREEVIGRRCHEIFQNFSEPCKRGDFVCPLEQVIKNRLADQQILTRVDHKGRLRYIEVTMFPIWGDKGKISKFIEISRDITDRKKEEEQIRQRLEGMVEERTRELKETHEKLLHQDKMASLGKLAASVVHEINNPVAGMLNFILLMQRIIEEKDLDSRTAGQFAQYLGLMETETRRVSRIASNLLAFSRQSKLELKPVDINRLVEKTLLLNGNLLKINRVRVERLLDPELPEIVGSEDQLQQVFMNLVSNAAEAMDSSDGGMLTIETRHLLEGNQIMIAFTDTGPGIPEENISKLFEPFFTTKKKGKGVGLGLSVAYGIVEEHGGTIQVESALGKGTTFRVLLPVSAGNGGLHGDR